MSDEMRCYRVVTRDDTRHVVYADKLEFEEIFSMTRKDSDSRLSIKSLGFS